MQSAAFCTTMYVQCVKMHYSSSSISKNYMYIFNIFCFFLGNLYGNITLYLANEFILCSSISVSNFQILEQQKDNIVEISQIQHYL